MKLQSLTISQFRNYQDRTFTFSPEDELVCFIGKNTIGKTNILEAMYVLSLLKSFRTNHLEDTLKWQEQHFRISGQVVEEEDTSELDATFVYHPRKQKKFRINGVDTAYSDYVGFLNTVFFSPDDINLLLLAPANRRKYIDILLSQSDRKYLSHVVKYGKVLKQRNALLKHIAKHQASIDELDYWNLQLAEHGVAIMTARSNLITRLNTTLHSTYKNIAGDVMGTFHIAYQPKMRSMQTTVEAFVLELQEISKRDLILESTSRGPHRDDFAFMLSDTPIQTFASRGDTRSMILALKLTEVQYLEQTLGRTPLLLLDDVFSELDQHRQEELLHCIPTHIQTFLTTTDDQIGKLSERTRKVRFIDLEEGL